MSRLLVKVYVVVTKLSRLVTADSKKWLFYVNWGGEFFFLFCLKKNKIKIKIWVLLVFYPFWFNNIVTIVYIS